MPPIKGPPATSADVGAIARHEAGHVVVGTRLGLEVLSSDLERDGEGGRGHTHFASPGAWFRPQPGRLTARERDLVERVVTTFMAGIAAEVRHGHADLEGAGYDLDQSARRWLRYLEPRAGRRADLAAEFMARAGRELEAPAAWTAVRAVGDALLAEGRLDGARARELVREAGA